MTENVEKETTGHSIECFSNKKEKRYLSFKEKMFVVPLAGWALKNVFDGKDVANLDKVFGVCIILLLTPYLVFAIPVVALRKTECMESLKSISLHKTRDISTQHILGETNQKSTVVLDVGDRDENEHRPDCRVKRGI